MGLYRLIKTEKDLSPWGLGGEIFMSTLYQWRKGGVILTAGFLAFTACSCANIGDSISPEEASTQIAEEVQAEGIQIDEELSAYVADGVILPEDFNFMIYPVEALMVGSYTQGLPYYNVKGQAKAFWFPMAVLSSLLEEHGVMAKSLYDDYCLYSEDEIDTFAAALYSSYASGDFKIPATEDGEPYVVYQEDSQEYAMLNGNIGDLGVRIIGCQPAESGYVINTELLNLESGEGITEFQVSMEPQKNPAGDGLFAYSVTGLKELADAGEEQSQEKDKVDSQAGALKAESDKKLKDNSQGSKTEKGKESSQSETKNQEKTEAVKAEPDQAVFEERIDQEEALTLARNYMGEEHFFTYKQMVTLSDCEYYDFSLEGSESGSTDVLVSVDGSDILTGIQNSDGSWTLDP